MFETHEQWAERTEAAATAAAGLCLASLGLGMWAGRRKTAVPAVCTGSSILGVGLRAATAAAALVASYCVFEAGHAGGKLVYQHGVGVNASAGTAAPVSAPAHRDDD